MSDTTDDLPTDATALASAYLDGEATPDQRALVEADPAVLDEVERLRQVRAVLGATTSPPPISVRELHLSAALDVWDRMSDLERSGELTPAAGMDAAAGAAITTPPPTSLSGRTQRRSGSNSPRWLLAAAAGLVVLAGAGFVFRSALDQADNDEGDASSAPTASFTEAPASEAEVIPEMAESAFSDEEVAADEAPIAVDGDDAAAEDIRTELAEDEPAEEPADAAPTTDSAAGQEQPEPSAEVDLDQLETPEDLADFGAFSAYAPQDAEAPPATTAEPAFATCDAEFAGFFDFDTFAGPAIYQGEQVIVAVDLSAELVVAYTDACEVVTQVRLPPRDEFEARTGN